MLAEWGKKCLRVREAAEREAFVGFMLLTAVASHFND
jgi:hypothetical protein